MKNVFYSALGLAMISLCFACGPAEVGGSGDSDSNHICGDQVCGVSELEGCPEDCGAGVPVCGNRVCSNGETLATCPEDCEGGQTDIGGGNNGGGNNGGGNNGNDGPCEYPEAGQFVDLGQVMPNLAWNGAYLPDGTTVDFSMEKWLCDEEYADYQTIAFVLGTGWCPACPGYFEHVNGLSSTLTSNNMMIIYIEAEDQNGTPGTHEYAYNYIGTLIGDGPGLRIGDGETLPAPRTLIQSPVVQSFPSGWIVRRSDMTVVASQHASQYIIPFEQIAADPDSGEWNGEPSIEPNCGEEDEEEYEGSNDDPRSAPSIEPGTSFDGGICAVGPDYYKIDIEGAWRADIEFEHSIGDLDLVLWDVAAGDVAKDENNRPIGSDSITDNESFEWEGPAVIMVFGYDFNTTTYRFSLTEL